LLGRAGVTGAETAVELPAVELVAKLEKYNVAPPLIGFGISTPEQVSSAIKAGAAGAISGSATVNIIAKNLGNSDNMHAELASFVSEMKAATAL
jgi:tryptophan synthase alpha chain